MEITPNKISGSPEELAAYFQHSGQDAPSVSAPNMAKSINGVWIVIIGIITGILMIITGIVTATLAHTICFGITILGIIATSILILCKYNNVKTAASVLLFLIIAFALILGVTKIQNVSDKALDCISAPK